MIDKIVITLDDSGKLVANFGEVHVLIAHNPIELMREINIHLRMLAHFPTGNHPMNANPITYEEFNKKQSKNKKS